MIQRYDVVKGSDTRKFRQEDSMGMTQRAEQAVEPGRRPAGMTRSPRGTRGPAREERIERRRREVREAATRVMTATGYHGMSMQAVADEAQMSVGLIYSYFG